MKARIHVFYKDGVFDPQGNTVQESLIRLGFSKVKGLRIGRVIDLELDYTTKEEAKREIKVASQKQIDEVSLRIFQNFINKL